MAVCWAGVAGIILLVSLAGVAGIILLAGMCRRA